MRFSARNATRLFLETLEDRYNPAPTLLQNVMLPGAGARWDFDSRGPFVASPIFADLDGDSRDEILAVGGDQELHAYGYDAATGAVILERTYSQRSFFLGDVVAPIQSTPVVVDLPWPNRRAVFAGTSDGRVFGWDALSGEILSGWPQNTSFDAHPASSRPGTPEAIYGALAAGDLDGDGIPEIVVTSFNNEVTAFYASGSVMWRFNNDESVFGGVAIGDLDRDGRPEVVVGGDSAVSPYYWQGGRVTCLSADGRRVWVKRTDQVVWSSPTLVDFDGDGTLEVVVGTGPYYGSANDYAGNVMYGLDKNGNDLPGWPYVTAPRSVQAFTYSSPAAGDLNGDGKLDVVFGDGQGTLHAVGGDGKPLWSVQPFATENLYSSPIIADVNGDGAADVVIGDTFGHLKAFSGKTGSEVWDYYDGLPHLNAAAVGHLKGDNSWQLAVVDLGLDDNNGRLLAPSSLLVFNLEATSLTPPWAQLRQDAGNNAVARPDSFAEPFLRRVFSMAPSRSISDEEMASLRARLRHAPGLAEVVRAVLGSSESQHQAVTNWYQEYLGRVPEAEGLAHWTALLNQPFANEVQTSIASSPEAFLHARGNNQAWVESLYRNLLGRSPGNGEEAGWVKGLNEGIIDRTQAAHSFVVSIEYTTRRVEQWFQTAQPGGQSVPSPDQLAALAMDLLSNRNEEDILVDFLTADGDYVATQPEGTWIRAAYMDLLRRTPSVEEVANWLNQDSGSFAATIVESPEYHNLLVSDWFQAYLHRPARGDEIEFFARQLDKGRPRTAILNDIFRSDEYWQRVGRDPAAFLDQTFRDVVGRAPSSSDIAFWIGRGDAREALPQGLLASPEFYAYLVGGQTFTSFYGMLLRHSAWTLPDYSRVVWPGTPFQAQDAVDFLLRGGSIAYIEAVILSSPEYYLLARDKAFWSGARWLS